MNGWHTLAGGVARRNRDPGIRISSRHHGTGVAGVRIPAGTLRAIRIRHALACIVTKWQSGIIIVSFPSNIQLSTQHTLICQNTVATETNTI
jgi:hypothetical protein